MEEKRIKELIELAQKAKEKAYAPYSGFKVGACLAASSGRLYTGCNIENASYGATVCAERTAVFKAVSEGEREFEAMALVSDAGKPVLPCGLCRQVLAEFSSKMLVISAVNANEYRIFSLKEILPEAFSKADMEH